MRDEKLHAVVAKHMSKSKVYKHFSLGALLEVEMMEKSTTLWREAHFAVKMYKARHVQSTWEFRCSKSARRCGTKHISKSKVLETDGFGPLLDVQMSFRMAGATDCAPCQKVSTTSGFCSISKNHGRRGAFEEGPQRCKSRGKRSTRDMFIRDVRRSGH